MKRLLGGSPLRQRFMIAPLLGLIVCGALTAAFVYESQRQNALLTRVTERDFATFNRYAEVFANLTEQHTALNDLLSPAAKVDDESLYDQAEENVKQAVHELEKALPVMDKTAEPRLAALRNQLSVSAKAYQKAAISAAAMATFHPARAPAQLAKANERFTAMSRSFVTFLNFERRGIGSEIAAKVRQSTISSTAIAAIGISVAALLFVLSWFLSRILTRSLEKQIGILTDLGAAAGASSPVEGSDEVERMARAIEAFRQALLANKTLATDLSEMKRIDRMKSEFVSVVSHELRTPLTSIRGSLGLIAGGMAGQLPDAAKNLIDIAKNNCERLVRLINNILDTEKIESGKMQFDLKVVELEPLLAQSIAANEGFAGQNHVSLKLMAGNEGARVNVDCDGLSQVLTNLLSNAVKFSPPGATVEVSLGHSQGCVRVEVRDRGSGIPEEFRPRIFQKFSQADSSDSRQKGGTGLGLSISKAIVERLGGTIGFRTRSGTGTTFFFDLPEWREPVRASQTAVSIAEAPAGGARDRPRILHVEGDPDIQHISATIARDFATFEFAATLHEARARLRPGKYDLVLLDLDLPEGEGTGWELLADVGALEPSPPVVVFSARDVGHAESLRVAAVLLKANTSNEQLLETVKRVLTAVPDIAQAA